MKSLFALLILLSTGCTLHVCGNSEIAHAVGESSIGEQQQNEDKATADVKADVPIKPN